MASRSDRVCTHGNESEKCSRCVAQLLAQSTEPSIVHIAPDGRIELLPLDREERPALSTQH